MQLITIVRLAILIKIESSCFTYNEFTNAMNRQGFKTFMKVMKDLAAGLIWQTLATTN